MCADMGNGVSADAERDTLVMDLLNKGVHASNADVGTMVHLTIKELCPQPLRRRYPLRHGRRLLPSDFPVCEGTYVRFLLHRRRDTTCNTLA